MMKTLLPPLTRTAAAVAAVTLMFSPLASAKPDHDRDDRAVAHRMHPWDRPWICAWIRDWIRDHDRDGGRDHDWNRDRDDRLSVHRSPSRVAVVDRDALPSVHRATAAIPVVPEANAGLVLIPFVGAVLFFSTRRLWATKAAQPANDQRA